jgi:hypothetical protein
MLESLTQFVTVLLALSIASERLVELFKGMISGLNGARANPDAERMRQLGVHWMSLVASVVVVYLAQDYIISSLKLKSGELPLQHLSPGLIATFSILTSGGSSMWNSILTYLLSLKNLKQQQVTDNKGQQQQQKAVDNAKTGNADLTVALPAAMPNI